MSRASLPASNSLQEELEARASEATFPAHPKLDEQQRHEKAWNYCAFPQHIEKNWYKFCPQIFLNIEECFRFQVSGFRFQVSEKHMYGKAQYLYMFEYPRSEKLYIERSSTYSLSLWEVRRSSSLPNCCMASYAKMGKVFWCKCGWSRWCRTGHHSYLNSTFFQWRNHIFFKDFCFQWLVSNFAQLHWLELQ